MNPFRRTNFARRAILRKFLLAGLAVACVVALGLFEYFLPLKSMLPARKIPARETGEMRVHFLDVGQGDCTVVEFPDGDALVVDGGNGSFQTSAALVRYLKGLNAVSYTLVATHADSDHIGGLAEILRYFPVRALYLPQEGSASRAYLRLEQIAKSRGAEIGTLVRYDVIARPSGAYAVCISPRSTEADESENDLSSVLYLRYAGVSVLLCGDATEKRERLLMREYALAEGVFDAQGYPVRLEETDILKVSHHGSADACCADWLELLGAKAAVLSLDRGNVYGHPAEETVRNLAQAGAEIYRTDELGNVVFSIRDGSYTIHTDSE